MRQVTTKENTYGFEIEFCTHDNTLLRYTHIEVAQIKLKGDAFELGNKLPLKIETDSGDVLELVTPPIIFSTIANAKKFREELAKYLKDSVAQPLTFEEWMKTYSDKLIKKMGEWYQTMEPWSALIEPDGSWESISFDNIKPNVSVNNIDDGINIAAANYRKSKMNGEEWKKYLSQTVLCASTKDYPTGYSTQLSLPMTELDYVKYVISNRFLKSTSNIRRLCYLLDQNPHGNSPEIDPTLEWEKVEKWLTTWFWGGVIFDMFHVYCKNMKKEINTNTLDWMLKYSQLEPWPNTLTQWSKKLSRLGGITRNPINIPITNDHALLFIIVQKTLTGTLGSLSERAQLKKQNTAQLKMNPSAMDIRDSVNRRDLGEYYWCEYHSALKDLLGVWFKGHLADVLSSLEKRKHLKVNVNHKLHLKEGLEAVGTQLKSIYKKRLELANQIVDKRFKRVYPEFVFMKDDKQLDKLITEHEKVIKATALFVSSDNHVWRSAEREQKFLDYSSGNTVWEGRKDTLIGPISHFNEGENENETFFLVEHRNN